MINKLISDSDSSSMASFRPISIVPTIGKLIESVMKDQLVSFFEKNNLFSELQHGFRQKRSTVTAATDLISRIQSGFESGDSVSLTLCDISKAFDCIPHNVLLSKLERYGVGGAVLRTIGSYFDGRQQVISLGGAQSQALDVRHGVPQGSVMGPVLFLIAINDLELQGSALRFADDTTIFASGPTPAASLLEAEALFNEAKNWFIANKLQLNEDKTQRLVCTLSSGYAEDQLSVNLLGFSIDQKLTWVDHISSTCKRLARVTFLLRKLTRLVSQHYLIIVYHALFHSVLSYGLLIWGHASAVQDILLLQKRAVRIVTSSAYLEHCKPLFLKTGILTVYAHYILVSAVYVHSNLHLFARRETYHSHMTRRRQDLDVPFCRLSKTRDSFPTLAIKIYNHLPTSLRNLDCRKFKLKLKNWLRTKPYYSLREFFEDTTDIP
jgi:hypothetical protein